MKTRQQWEQENQMYTALINADQRLTNMVEFATICEGDYRACLDGWHIVGTDRTGREHTLEAFQTKREAIAFCKQMGWRVQK